MNKVLKTIGKICSNLLVALVVLATLALVAPRVAGWRPFTVLSGSMEPTYHVGSLIYVKEVPASEIQVGDPITFVLNEDLVVVTHRVTAIDAENQRFTTKGDANDSEDLNPVHFNNLVGRPVFSIPYLGYVSGFLETSRGKIVAVTALLVLAILVFLPDVLNKIGDKKQGGEQPPQKEEASK